jgi:hypothetical protein
MDTQRRIAVFLADYDHQLSEICRIFDILDEKKVVIEEQPVASEVLESTGYWMHNLYGAFEDLFKLAAGFWENDIGPEGEFHISVLRRMLVHIEGIRPALLSDESYGFLNELRGFRHVFRHAYSYGLDEERVSFLLRRTLERKRLLLNDLQRFRAAVAAMTNQ